MLIAHPDCKACALHAAGCKRVGIATRVWHTDAPLRDVAVVFVGGYPSVAEDESGVPYSGPAGAFLRRIYIEYRDLAAKASIYITNVTRCKPPRDVTPTAAQCRTCWSLHGLADLAVIRRRHPRPFAVNVVLMGSEACSVVLGRTVKESLYLQGAAIDGVRYFVTTNPGVCLPGADPAQAIAIKDHLDILHDWLDNGKLPVAGCMPQPERCVIPAPVPGERYVGFDIETYGAVDGLPVQRCFHAAKSIALDGVPRNALLQTAAFAWRGDAGVRCSTFVLPDDAVLFRKALSAVAVGNLYLLGANTLFDASYVRAAGYMLLPDTHRLADLMQWNVIESNVRPEHSLKTISRVLRTADYSGELSLRDGDRYASRYDERLLTYNAMDAYATLMSQQQIEQRIRHGFGDDHPALTEYSRRFFSDWLWAVLAMQEAGVEFDRAALTRLGSRVLRRRDRLLAFAKRRWGIKLTGTGSKKPIADEVLAAVQQFNLLDDPRLARSTVRREISVAAENIGLLEAVLPIRNRCRSVLRVLSATRRYDKLYGSYVRTLLHGSKIDKRTKCAEKPQAALVGNRAYPNYYVAPSYMHDSDADSDGGTVQARLAAKDPAVQTLPPQVKACRVSRWGSSGVLLEPDYSNLEDRVAALLSGDPAMTATYDSDNPDPHADTAAIIWGDAIREHPRFRAYYRQAAKQARFLVLFRGSWRKLQATLRLRCRIELPDDECAAIVQRMESGLAGLRCWQDALIAEVTRKGYLTLPLIGDTRRFTQHARAISETYVSTICNFPVQTTAARIAQSAQIELADALRGLRAVIAMQTHDSLLIDTHRNDLMRVADTARHVLPAGAFYSRLCDSLQRYVPLSIDLKQVRPAT